MYWIEKIATICVILPQVRKKIHFGLVSRKIVLCQKVQIYRRRKHEKDFNISIRYISASGCSEMAAFNTKINKALKTASFNQKTLADIRNLQSECKRQHDMGMSVSSISSCNKALDLVAVN